MSQNPLSESALTWPEPDWLIEIEDERTREVERTKFLLSLACIYYSQRGSSASLAEAVGLSPNAFALVKNRGKPSPELIVRIESALGRHLFPRELFRPDLFSVD